LLISFVGFIPLRPRFRRDLVVVAEARD
jgi:hypothetical protein